MTLTIKKSSRCKFCIGGTVMGMDGEEKCINCGRTPGYKPPKSKGDFVPTIPGPYFLKLKASKTDGCRAATKLLGKKSRCLVNCPFPDFCYHDKPKTILAIVRKNGNGKKN